MNKRKCMYVSFIADNSGGGMCSKINKKLLKEIFEERLIVIEFRRPQDRMTKLLQTMSGYLYGLNSSICRNILETIGETSSEYVFLNSSQYGILAERIKKLYPNVTIITFYHGIEYLFCLNAFKRIRRPQNLITLAAVRYNEDMTVRYSDKIICLNEREGRNLKRLYGRIPDLLLPICLEDRLDTERMSIPPKHGTRKKGLFVGSNFFANYYGIKWFVENVASYIDAEIEIVGMNFEERKSELEISENVKVIGSVEDVDSFYYDSDFVIAPIFDGAGMKVKTAEALMFGKTIYGTKEAFEGYDLDFKRVGGLCENRKQFVNEIENSKPKNGRFNEYCRNEYLKKYSYERSLKRFRTIFV